LAEKARDTSITCAIVSSVIPLGEIIEESIAALPFPCLRMSAKLRMPFSIAYRTPDTLGPDRLAAVAEACMQQPGRDLLVIDSGTAITYDLVTADGLYVGGNISPGIGMRLKALHHYTGKLPLVDKEGDRVSVGDTTETAIREGVLQGVDYEIDGYIRAYTLKYPELLVFLTGGNAFLLDNRLKNRTFADNLLVVKGLNRILKLNNE
jgi:type III pantothenate kinase